MTIMSKYFEMTPSEWDAQVQRMADEARQAADFKKWLGRSEVAINAATTQAIVSKVSELEQQVRQGQTSLEKIFNAARKSVVIELWEAHQRDLEKARKRAEAKAAKEAEEAQAKSVRSGPVGSAPRPVAAPQQPAGEHHQQ